MSHTEHIERRVAEWSPIDLAHADNGCEHKWQITYYCMGIAAIRDCLKCGAECYAAGKTHV